MTQPWDLDPEVEKHLETLHVLAWGDSLIVETAINESLEKVRPIWWKFWKWDWRINWETAYRKVIEERNRLNSIQANEINLNS